jgi:hypothetical protein
VSSLLICFLGAWIDLGRENGCDIKMILPRHKKCAEAIRAVKAINGSVGRPKISISQKMCQLRKFEEKNPNIVKDMIQPLEMRFHGAIQIVLNELLTNALDHSGESACFCAAGSWGRSDAYHFTFLDLGIGIPQKLRSRYPEFETDKEALQKLLASTGLTTRINKAGGFGYGHIKDIVGGNGGRLHVFAGQAKAVIKFDKGEWNFKVARRNFPGTCVDVQISLNGPIAYDADSEKENNEAQRQEEDFF